MRVIVERTGSAGNASSTAAGLWTASSTPIEPTISKMSSLQDPASGRESSAARSAAGEPSAGGRGLRRLGALPPGSRCLDPGGVERDVARRALLDAVGHGREDDLTISGEAEVVEIGGRPETGGSARASRTSRDSWTSW